ncbi:MAG TPA: lysophospholipid acyltransferase family protein [Anaeromyxobacteraceae bacterium]|nr:lysophospholipid acyltransferase family protein [Anaeromyxobacteraceae bacterium]
MRRVLAAFGGFLGWLLWTLHVRRGVVMENLRLAFPDWTEARRREVGRRTFENLGRMATEFLTVSRLSPEERARYLAYEDPARQEEIARNARSGRPMLVCTAHYGNFENLAAVHNMMGIPVAMVVRALGGGWFGKFWNRVRSGTGLEVLEVKRGETLKAAQRAMRDGRVLGYVIDQNMPGHRAIFPTFFGVPAATAPTPAYLAMRSGAIVFFVLDVPQPDGTHRIIVEGPLEPRDTGDREADVLAFMQDLNDRLERWVRLHPEHWYWLHRRWKTRPPPEGKRAPRPRRTPPAPH